MAHVSKSCSPVTLAFRTSCGMCVCVCVLFKGCDHHGNINERVWHVASGAEPSPAVS